MKKIFAITGALIFMLAGMQLSFDVHFCHGRLAAEKFSFTGAKASCGMAESCGNCTVPAGIAANCCRDKLTSVTIDNSIAPLIFHLKSFIRDINQLGISPHFNLYQSLQYAELIQTDARPPGNTWSTSVNLPAICIFRL